MALERVALTSLSLSVEIDLTSHNCPLISWRLPVPRDAVACGPSPRYAENVLGVQQTIRV